MRRLQVSFDAHHNGMAGRQVPWTRYARNRRCAPWSWEGMDDQAVTLASIGKEAEATPIFTTVFAREPQWAELLGRLPAAGLFPNDAALLRRIQALAPRPRERF